MSNAEPSSKRGRPPEVAPAGYVTIEEAAQLAGVSYATVYRAVQRGDVANTRQADNGARFIPSREVPKIRRRTAQPPRRVYLPGVSEAQLRRWRKAAEARGLKLSDWARRALDAVSMKTATP